MTPSATPAVHGECSPGLEAVRDVFAENLARHGELGAAFAVVRDGLPLVDLWGGLAHRGARRPWERDTRVCMNSLSKGLAATCATLLIQDGVLDPDEPVARAWPEFAQHGKERLTVEQVLGHRSGVLHFAGLKRGDLLVHAQAARGIERARPAWEEAGRGAYHSATFGVMVRELVQRVAGTSLDAFFEQRVSRPLGGDFRFTANEDDLPRIAHLEERSFHFLRTLVLEQPYALRMLKCWWAMPALGREGFNSRAWLTSGLASGAGAGTALGVARIASGLVGGLFDESTLARVTRAAWEGRCPVSGAWMKVTQRGFLMNTPHAEVFGPGPRSFGSIGRGGALFLADPDRRLGVAYATNQLSDSGFPDERSRRLVDAVYRALAAVG